MKKLFCVFAVALLLLSLSACGGSDIIGSKHYSDLNTMRGEKFVKVTRNMEAAGYEWRRYYGFNSGDIIVEVRDEMIYSDATKAKAYFDSIYVEPDPAISDPEKQPNGNKMALVGGNTVYIYVEGLGRVEMNVFAGKTPQVLEDEAESKGWGFDVVVFEK